MDPQLPAQLVQFLAPSLRWKVKAIPAPFVEGASRETIHNGVNESTTACPFVYSFPIR